MTIPVDPCTPFFAVSSTRSCTRTLYDGGGQEQEAVRFQGEGWSYPANYFIIAPVTLPRVLRRDSRSGRPGAFRGRGVRALLTLTLCACSPFSSYAAAW